MRIILIDMRLMFRDNPPHVEGATPFMDLSVLTRKQRQVFDAFERERRPLTAQQAWMAAGIESLGQATVYRAIGKLEDLGLLLPVDVHGAQPMWETKSPGHHHHFFCNACRRVYDLPGCAGNLRSMIPEGFSMENHTITIYGNCAACQKA